MINLRLRRAWLGQTATPATKVVELSDAQWSQVTAAPKAVVKFYSPNCPYSRAFAPIYDALSLQYPDVLFAAINVDQSTQQAGTNKIQMLPTVIFFVNGQPVGRIDGVQDQSDFITEMSKAFSGGGAAPAATPAATVPAVTSPRAGTLVDVPTPTSPIVYVAGGAAAVAALGTAAYFLFRGK